MSKTKKIIIGILIVAIGWICFRVVVVSYALYQDGWRIGSVEELIKEITGGLKSMIIQPTEIPPEKSEALDRHF